MVWVKEDTLLSLGRHRVRFLVPLLLPPMRRFFFYWLVLLTGLPDGPAAAQTSKSNSARTSLDDFYVSYQLNAYTRQAAIYSRIHQHIQDQFNAAGVEIMSPHYRAARDGNQCTIPADDLPKDYAAPKFRVEGKE